MNKKAKRVCAVCGKMFSPRTHNSAYCSSACYKKAKSMRDKARKSAHKASAKSVKKVAPAKVAKPSKAVKQAKKTNAVVTQKIALQKPPKKVVCKKVEFKKLTDEQAVAFAIKLLGLAVGRILAK